MSAHVLLILLSKLRKRDKKKSNARLMSILSLFRNKLNKFNNTSARV